MVARLAYSPVIVTLKLQDAEFPDWSIAVYVIWWNPMGNMIGGVRGSMLDVKVIAALELSVGTGVVQLTVFMVNPCSSPSITILAGHSITGSPVSVDCIR